MNSSIARNLHADNLTDFQLKILIVDDREENLFALKALLSNVGAEVVCAISGTEALSILAQDPNFSLILMDVQMPQLDGFSTVQLIKNHPRTKHIAIIFITAILKDARYIQKGYDSGAIDYMCKPIDPKILLQKVAVFLDMDFQKKQMAAMLEKTTKLEKGKNLILEHIQESIVAVSENGNIIYTNPAAAKLLGYREGELIGKSIELVLPNTELRGNSWQESRHYQLIQSLDVLRKKDTLLIKSDKSTVNIGYSFGAYRAEGINGGVFIIQDISEQKRFESTLMYMATHDALTGLANRTLFGEIVDNAFKRSQLNQSLSVVMFIDLDHFKKINIELGHEAGDSVILTLANRLKAIVKDIDCCSRLGGDEFGLLFEDVDSQSDLDKLATQVITAIKAPLTLSGHVRVISCSVGIVALPKEHGSAGDIMKAADIAMHKAKDLGRDQYVVFESHDKQSLIWRNQTEQDLNFCIQKNEIRCAFQPILNCLDKTLNSFEVLMRWEHSERGIIMPNDFIPIAEESNLIVSMGNQIIDLACELLARWLKLGLWPQGARLAINISVKQLIKGEILTQVKDAAAKHNINLNLIELEITESIIMSEPENVIIILGELQALGVQISIDDFGTGYSSLMYLRRLPIDTIKIDQVFVDGIGKNKGDEKIVEATINLSHNLGLRVVSEGVETKEQELFLIKTGSDNVQGYLYSKPMSPNEAETWLKQH